MGPTNKDLIRQIEERINALRASGIQGPIPAELAMASASGLDPHISPQAALAQVPRIARERNMPEETLRKLVSEHTEARQFGFLGRERLNVLELNLAMDSTEARR